MNKLRVVIAGSLLILAAASILFYFNLRNGHDKPSAIELTPISETEARVIAVQILFEPGIQEQTGCDPRRLSNLTVHRMDARWLLVTLDAVKESRRIYIMIRPDRSAEVAFVSWLEPGKCPLCD